MRLEIGKTYISRDGFKKVTIVRNNKAGSLRVVGSNGFIYEIDGFFANIVGGHNGEHDLVSECPHDLQTRQEALAEAVRLEIEAKVLREKFKQPKLAPGQVWQSRSDIYIITDDLHGTNLKTGIVTASFFSLTYATYLGTFDEVFTRKGEK